MKNEISAAGNLIQIISQSKQNALKKVNEELIQMYWKAGEYLSTESIKASFGDAYYRYGGRRNPKCISWDQRI